MKKYFLIRTYARETGVAKTITLLFSTFNSIDLILNHHNNTGADLQKLKTKNTCVRKINKNIIPSTVGKIHCFVNLTIVIATPRS